MGIFDLFKKKPSKAKFNIKNDKFNKSDFQDIDKVAKICKDYSERKIGSEENFAELIEFNKLKEEESRKEKELFEECFQLFNKAKDLKQAKKDDEALSLFMEIIYKYNPCGTSYYEEPIEICEKSKDYDKALKIALIGDKNIRKYNMNNNHFHEKIFELKDRLSQTQCYLSNFNADNINSKNELSKCISSWNISISFGKSSSSNYSKAVYLAKQNPSYFEDAEGKNIIHQVTYTSAPNDYLSFIKLYELVGGWKSSFVFINGEMIDRKVIGKLNYCYGDKCRSGNNKFCYGASQFTANPFGCHRLQVSEHNNPWWSFGILDTKGIWHVDKKAILERIKQHYLPYVNCPSFSYDKIIYNLNQLPNTINPRKDKSWEIRGNLIFPKNYGVSTSIEISLDDF